MSRISCSIACQYPSLLTRTRILTRTHTRTHTRSHTHTSLMIYLSVSLWFSRSFPRGGRVEGRWGEEEWVPPFGPSREWVGVRENPLGRVTQRLVGCETRPEVTNTSVSLKFSNRPQFYELLTRTDPSVYLTK